MRRAAFVLFVAATGCGIGSIPDPKDAARDYAEAASKGDSARIYDMMTSAGQRSRSREDVQRLVNEQRAELAEQAKSITGRDARTEAVARLRYAGRSVRFSHFGVRIRR